MKFRIFSDTKEETKEFMERHRDSSNLKIVRARVESIELVDDEYRWVQFDINEKGNYIKGTVEVLDRECDMDI